MKMSADAGAIGGIMIYIELVFTERLELFVCLRRFNYWDDNATPSDLMPP